MSAEIVTEARSRRAILAALGGGLAALVAQAIGRPLPLKAATGGNTILGVENLADAETVIRNTDLAPPGGGAPGETAFRGQSAAGIGIKGVSVEISPTNTGVYGIAGDDENVASDTQQTGVYGFAQGNDLAGLGVWGDSAQGVGVLATGGDGGLIADGYAGVTGFGDLETGVGVVGSASTGVFGYSGPDPGFGPAANTGVSAHGTWPDNAAYFDGKTVFKRAGLLAVTAGHYYATKSDSAERPQSHLRGSDEQPAGFLGRPRDEVSERHRADVELFQRRTQSARSSGHRQRERRLLHRRVLGEQR